MPNEYTFVMLRPGALRRKKVIIIMNLIKASNLSIDYFELKELTSDFINEHYRHLISDDIPYDVFTRTMTENLSGEVIGLIVSGDNAVRKMRDLIGPSNVKNAVEEFPNTIRAMGNPNNNPDNLIHSSDSVDSAKEEIRRFFGFDMEQDNKINFGKKR